MKIKLLLLSFIFGIYTVSAQSKFDSIFIKTLFDSALVSSVGTTYLKHLTKKIGHRLSGSKQSEEAVAYSTQFMKSIGFDTVYLQEVMVPVWKRGNLEEAKVKTSKGKELPLEITALGNSVGTLGKTISAEVVEVRDFESVKSREDIKGKIVFYNIPMEPKVLNTFSAYS